MSLLKTMSAVLVVGLAGCATVDARPSKLYSAALGALTAEGLATAKKDPAACAITTEWRITGDGFRERGIFACGSGRFELTRQYQKKDPASGEFVPAKPKQRAPWVDKVTDQIIEETGAPRRDSAQR